MSEYGSGAHAKNHRAKVSSLLSGYKGEGYRQAGRVSVPRAKGVPKVSAAPRMPRRPAGLGALPMAPDAPPPEAAPMPMAKRGGQQRRKHASGGTARGMHGEVQSAGDERVGKDLKTNDGQYGRGGKAKRAKHAKGGKVNPFAGKETAAEEKAEKRAKRARGGSIPERPGRNEPEVGGHDDANAGKDRKPNAPEKGKSLSTRDASYAKGGRAKKPIAVLAIGIGRKKK